MRVVLQIDRDVQERIRSDSVASIGTIGLLGDQYVEISMGTSAGRVLEDGAEIASVSPIDLSMAVMRGTEALDNVATLAANLNLVVGSFHEAMGGERLADATGAAAKAAEDLGGVVRQVREGKGLLHSLIYDEYEGGEVASVRARWRGSSGSSRRSHEGDGVLHDLVYDAGERAGPRARGARGGRAPEQHPPRWTRARARSVCS